MPVRVYLVSATDKRAPRCREKFAQMVLDEFYSAQKEICRDVPAERICYENGYSSVMLST